MDNEEKAEILFELLEEPKSCKDISTMCDYVISFIEGLEEFHVVADVCPNTCDHCTDIITCPFFVIFFLSQLIEL
jgi:hypothetical protein